MGPQEAPTQEKVEAEKMVRKDGSTVLYKDGLMVRCCDGDQGKEFCFGDASSGDLGASGACTIK